MTSPPESPSHLNMLSGDSQTGDPSLLDMHSADSQHEPSTFVRALYDYVSQDDSSLTFQQGDVIEVLTKLPSGWWDGLLGDARGWFPSNYVDEVTEDEMYAPEETDQPSAADDLDDEDGRRKHFWQQQQFLASGLESALSLSTSTYPTDGNFSASLGPDHDYEHLLAGTSQADVFKQLAEEGMQGPIDPSQSLRPAPVLTSKPSTAVEGEALDQASRNATIDLGGTSGSGAPTSSRLTSPAVAGPSEREMQRQQQDSTSIHARPRAATTLASQFDPHKAPFRGRAASTGTSNERKAAKESDYWVPRYHDRDGIVYYNTRTGAESREIPDGLDLDYALSPQGSDEDDDYNADGGFATIGSDVGRVLPMQGSNYFEKLRQDGKPGLLPLKAAGGRLHSLHDEARPPSMTRDEEETYELQKMLMPSTGLTLGQLLHIAFDRLSQLIDICAEAVDPQGFSELDRRAAVHTPALLDKSGLRLSKTSNSVVQAVRDLLYCVGSLGMTSADLTTVAELVPSPYTLDTTSMPTAGEFSGAFTAMYPRSAEGGKGPGASMPSTLRSTGARVSSLLSKLVLSVRAVTEQPVFISRDARNAALDNDLARSHAEKLTSYRHRIREDAIELVNVLDIFGRELEKQKATKSNPSWSRRLEGTFRSGDGSAGVSPLSLSGGAAAGWRGAGFVLPSAYETAALRFESQGHFGDPAELSKDARTLLAAGKEHLKRRPSQLLSASFVADWVKPQFEDLSQLLTHLQHSLRPQGERPSSDSPKDEGEESPSSSSSSSFSSDTLLVLQGLAAQRAFDQLQAIQVRFGTFVALLEDIDFASVLDVDLPSWNADDGTADSQAASLVYSAKEGLQRFNALKQGCYDVCSQLLLESQSLSAVLAGHPSEIQISERLSDYSGALKSLTGSVLELTMDIAQIAEEQDNAQLSSIGARSKVYDLEDIMSETSHLFAPRSLQQQQQQQNLAHRGSDASTSSAYLAPSLSGAASTLSASHGPQSHSASGQRTTSLRSASSSAVSPTSTTVARAWPGSGPNAGIAAAARNRSMSVATGASAPSTAAIPPHVAGSRLRSATESQPNDNAAESETESAKAPNRASSKLRKFFGDDSASSQPQQQQQPPPASASSHGPSADGSSVVSSTATAVSGGGSKKQDDSPWFLQPEYGEKEIVVSPEGQVKGATLGALMERLTMHNTFDASFNNTLLMTYRSFTTTSELLELLFARFRITAPQGLSAQELKLWSEKKQQPIRLRVFSVLKSWLESFFYEGEDEEHLDKIRMFAVEIQSHSMELPSRQLLRLVERRQGDGEQMIRKMVLPQSAPPPILPKSRRIKFLDIDATEMARQLTLLESKLYNKIKPMECLGKAWSKPDSDVHAKGIKDTISTSNKITGWVAEAILVQDDLKKRAAWIKQFIAIADACRSLNNFSTMTAIVSGLNSAPVYRLKRSWDAVNQRYVMMLENLNRIMQSSKNFSDYREMIHKLNPPCVPFLGVYLTDLTFIEDGNPDRLRADERLINFGKRQKTAEVIREIMIYQSTPYNLTPVAGIQKFIQDNLVEARTDSDLYTQSLALEPREREDEKISRLLAESGFI